MYFWICVTESVYKAIFCNNLLLVLRIEMFAFSLSSCWNQAKRKQFLECVNFFKNALLLSINHKILFDAINGPMNNSRVSTDWRVCVLHYTSLDSQSIVANQQTTIVPFSTFSFSKCLNMSFYIRFVKRWLENKRNE